MKCSKVVFVNLNYLSSEIHGAKDNAIQSILNYNNHEIKVVTGLLTFRGF